MIWSVPDASGYYYLALQELVPLDTVVIVSKNFSGYLERIHWLTGAASGRPVLVHNSRLPASQYVQKPSIFANVHVPSHSGCGDSTEER